MYVHEYLKEHWQCINLLVSFLIGMLGAYLDQKALGPRFWGMIFSWLCISTLVQIYFL